MAIGINNNTNDPDPVVRLSRRVADLERLVRELASARTLNNSTIDSGDLQVVNGGSVNVGEASAAQLILAEQPDPISGLTLGCLSFTSAAPAAAGQAGFIGQFDQGLGSLLVMKSLPNAAGDSALASVAGGNGAQLSANRGNGHAGATLAVVAGSPYDTSYGGSGVFINTANTSWVLYNNVLNIGGVSLVGAATGEWQAKTNDLTAYVPIRASSFPIGSSREVKEDVAAVPFDALAAVNAAEPMQWRYKEEFAADPNPHVSPMAEDLPAELVHEADGVKSIDLLSLTGTLWAAVRQLSARVDQQQKVIEELQRAAEK